MKNIKITAIPLLLILIFLTATEVFANEWKMIYSLKGKWKFSIGDDKNWAKKDFNDSNWDVIHAPSSWENQGFHGYNGYAWYRKHFQLSWEYENETIYLHLGYIDDVDEVYVNGQLIGFSGTFPPDYNTAYNANRIYPVPAEYLNFNGDNLIAIRVYDSQVEGGIVWGDLGVYVLDENLRLKINLAGQWKFHIHDDLDWANKDYDDSDWKRIIVPAYWETQGYNDYNGIGWYRKTFTLPENFSDEKLILILGKIDDIDETYVNGKLVGGIGEFRDDIDDIQFSNEWNELRGYYLPKGLLKPGKENTIAVRVYDGYINGGIYQGPIGITTQDKYVDYWRKMRKKEKGFWERVFD